MALLGPSLLGHAKFDEPQPMLMAGFEGLRARESTIPPQGKVRVPECLDRLIELYEELERPPELIKYQAIRDEYPQHLFPTASKLLSK